MAQSQGNNFCLRQRLISSRSAFHELPFKTTCPTGCAGIMYLPAQPVSASQGTNTVHYPWQFVPTISNMRSEASFWESSIPIHWGKIHSPYFHPWKPAKWSDQKTWKHRTGGYRHSWKDACVQNISEKTNVSQTMDKVFPLCQCS